MATLSQAAADIYEHVNSAASLARSQAWTWWWPAVPTAALLLLTLLWWWARTATGKHGLLLVLQRAAGWPFWPWQKSASASEAFGAMVLPLPPCHAASAGAAAARPAPCSPKHQPGGRRGAAAHRRQAAAAAASAGMKPQQPTAAASAAATPSGSPVAPAPASPSPCSDGQHGHASALQPQLLLRTSCNISKALQQQGGAPCSSNNSSSPSTPALQDPSEVPSTTEEQDEDVLQPLSRVLSCEARPASFIGLRHHDSAHSHHGAGTATSMGEAGTLCSQPALQCVPMGDLFSHASLIPDVQTSMEGNHSSSGRGKAWDRGEDDPLEQVISLLHHSQRAPGRPCRPARQQQQPEHALQARGTDSSEAHAVPALQQASSGVTAQQHRAATAANGVVPAAAAAASAAAPAAAAGRASACPAAAAIVAPTEVLIPTEPAAGLGLPLVPPAMAMPPVMAEGHGQAATSSSHGSTAASACGMSLSPQPSLTAAAAGQLQPPAAAPAAGQLRAVSSLGSSLLASLRRSMHKATGQDKPNKGAGLDRSNSSSNHNKPAKLMISSKHGERRALFNKNKVLPTPTMYAMVHPRPAASCAGTPAAAAAAAAPVRHSLDAAAAAAATAAAAAAAIPVASRHSLDARQLPAAGPWPAPDLRACMEQRPLATMSLASEASSYHTAATSLTACSRTLSGGHGPWWGAPPGPHASSDQVAERGSTPCQLQQQHAGQLCAGAAAATATAATAAGDTADCERLLHQLPPSISQLQLQLPRELLDSCGSRRSSRRSSGSLDVSSMCSPRMLDAQLLQQQQQQQQASAASGGGGATAGSNRGGAACRDNYGSSSCQQEADATLQQQLQLQAGLALQQARTAWAAAEAWADVSPSPCSVHSLLLEHQASSPCSTMRPLLEQQASSTLLGGQDTPPGLPLSLPLVHPLPYPHGPGNSRLAHCSTMPHSSAAGGPATATGACFAGGPAAAFTEGGVDNPGRDSDSHGKGGAGESLGELKGGSVEELKWRLPTSILGSAPSPTPDCPRRPLSVELPREAPQELQELQGSYVEELQSNYLQQLQSSYTMWQQPGSGTDEEAYAECMAHFHPDGENPTPSAGSAAASGAAAAAGGAAAGAAYLSPQVLQAALLQQLQALSPGSPGCWGQTTLAAAGGPPMPMLVPGQQTGSALPAGSLGSGDAGMAGGMPQLAPMALLMPGQHTSFSLAAGSLASGEEAVAGASPHLGPMALGSPMLGQPMLPSGVPPHHTAMPGISLGVPVFAQPAGLPAHLVRGCAAMAPGLGPEALGSPRLVPAGASLPVPGMQQIGPVMALCPGSPQCQLVSPAGLPAGVAGLPGQLVARLHGNLVLLQPSLQLVSLAPSAAACLSPGQLHHHQQQVAQQLQQLQLLRAGGAAAVKSPRSPYKTSLTARVKSVKHAGAPPAAVQASSTAPSVPE